MRGTPQSYERNYLNQFEKDIDLEIVVFEKYIAENESIIFKIDQSLKINSQRDFFRNHFFQHHSFIEEQLLKEFKSTQKASLLTFMNSFFKSKFQLLCEVLETELKSETIIMPDKTNIESCFVFLREKLSIERPHLEKYFGEINRICKIRKVWQSGTMLSGDEIILISKVDDATFLQDFLKNIQTFFSSLLVQIDERFRNTNS